MNAGFLNNNFENYYILIAERQMASASIARPRKYGNYEGTPLPSEIGKIIDKYADIEYEKTCAEFIDPRLCDPTKRTYKVHDESGRMIDCTYYCMKNCNPAQLWPIYHDLPSKIIFTNPEDEKDYYEYDIRQIATEINIYEPSEHYLVIWKNLKSQTGWYVGPHKSNIGNPEEHLCNFIKEYSMPYPRDFLTHMSKLRFRVDISTYKYIDIPDNYIMTFDKPYIRPFKDWIATSDFIRLNITLR